MFREMRKQKRLMTREHVEAVLKSQNYGVLSLMGDEGYPYGVPVNYGWYDGKFYIHSVNHDSHKLDAIARSDKVCFTVIGRNDYDADEYTTHFDSVIVFGRARVVESAEERIEAMKRMMAHLAPQYLGDVMERCAKNTDSYAMIEIIPEHISGKSHE